MMVPLASFPTDLLSHICRFVDPEDFVNFSLLNRRFQAIAEPFREHHYQQYSKYAIIQDRETSSYWFWHSILRSVLEGWAGAKYVRTLKLHRPVEDRPRLDLSNPLSTHVIHDWDFEECREVLRPSDGSHLNIYETHLLGSDVSQVPREYCQLITQALKHVPWFAGRDPNQVEDELDKPSFILALLAWFLPNLRTLAIARSSSSELYHLYNAVRYAARSLSVPGVRYGPFSSLREVDFIVTKLDENEYPEDVWNWPGCFESSFFLPFVSLPSFRSLKAAHVVEPTLSHATKLQPSKLTHLSLWSLDIHPNELSPILEGITNLQSCELSTDAPSWNFSTADAVGVLLANASNTLEKLMLHTHPVIWTDNLPVSFASFNKLVYLDIVYEILNLPAMDATEVNSLPELLPASLETLRIRTRECPRGFAANILALITDTPPKQPKLKCLIVRGRMYDKYKEDIQRACRLRNIRCGGDLATKVVG